MKKQYTLCLPHMDFRPIILDPEYRVLDLHDLSRTGEVMVEPYNAKKGMDPVFAVTQDEKMSADCQHFNVHSLEDTGGNRKLVPVSQDATHTLYILEGKFTPRQVMLNSMVYIAELVTKPPLLKPGENITNVGVKPTQIGQVTQASEEMLHAMLQTAAENDLKYVQADAMNEAGKIAGLASW